MGQDRTAVVGALGVPSVACDREKAGTEGPVLAQNGHGAASSLSPLWAAKRTWLIVSVDWDSYYAIASTIRAGVPGELN